MRCVVLFHKEINNLVTKVFSPCHLNNDNNHVGVMI